MSQKLVTINSILNGISPTQYQGAKGFYDSSIAIDPDYPVNGNVKTSGVIVPVVYEKFSSTNVNSAPVNIVTNTKTSNVYVQLSNGRIVSYNNSLGSETLVSSTPDSGDGMAYYNNYLYYANGGEIYRYGPLDGSPSQVAYWVGTLGLTAPSTSSLGSIQGVNIPRHTMFSHVDGALYFCDYSNGFGLVNKIKTTKTTSEGDTNNGSAYNVLDLPFGYRPVSIRDYGTDLVILAVQTTDTVINQGKSALFFWDTVSVTFYRKVSLPDPIATAMINCNGELFIWTGNSQNGVRLSKYVGGESVSTEVYLEEGNPPFQGSVDTLGDKIAWGAWTTYPSISASVFSFRSKRSGMQNSLTNIAKSTSTGSSQNVTSVKYVQQDGNIKPKIVIGWNDNIGSGIDKYSTTNTFSSVWRSNIFSVGNTFQISEIRIPFGSSISPNMTVTPKVYLDDLSSSVTLNTINSTNYNGKRHVRYKRPSLIQCKGENNFLLELNFTGTVSLPVTLPIVIVLDVFQDEQ